MAHPPFARSPFRIVGCELDGCAIGRELLRARHAVLLPETPEKAPASAEFRRRPWSVISFSWLRRREGGRRKIKGGRRQLVCRSPSADHVSLSVPESLSGTVRPLLSLPGDASRTSGHRARHVHRGESPGNFGLNARSPGSSPDHSQPEIQVTAKRGLGVGSPPGGVSSRALPEAHQPHRGQAKRSGSPEFTMSTGSSGVSSKEILRFLYVKRAICSEGRSTGSKDGALAVA